MKFLVTIILALTLSGCDKIYINPTNPSDPPSDNGRGSNPASQIQFRVNGNATSVRIRYSNPLDGLTQVITTLPYITTLSTNDSSMFLSIEATPLSYGTTTFPFLSAQIFVNGILFREATSSDFTGTTISASGNWRK
jgi:hypothetical protein